MPSLRILGGSAAIALSVLFVLVLFVLFSVLPMLGAESIADLRDPAKVLPAIVERPLLPTINLVDVPIFVCLLAVILAVNAELGDRKGALCSVDDVPGLALQDGNLGIHSRRRSRVSSSHYPAFDAPNRVVDDVLRLAHEVLHDEHVGHGSYPVLEEVLLELSPATVRPIQ